MSDHGVTEVINLPSKTKCQIVQYGYYHPKIAMASCIS